MDASVSRSIRMRALGDNGRLYLRADLFNLFNHANLGMPSSTVCQPGFGYAFYGREGYSTGFPVIVPFRETARQLQLMLRAEF